MAEQIKIEPGSGGGFCVYRRGFYCGVDSWIMCGGIIRHDNGWRFSTTNSLSAGELLSIVFEMKKLEGESELSAIFAANGIPR